jgi:hypothetical protein
MALVEQDSSHCNVSLSDERTHAVDVEQNVGGHQMEAVLNCALCHLTSSNGIVACKDSSRLTGTLRKGK